MSLGPDRWTLRASIRSLIALVLSFLSPGLGQVYNGQLLRGALFYASALGFLELSSVLGLPRSYRGFIVHLVITMTLFILIIADAVWTAGHQAKTAIPKRGWQAYVLAGAMLLVTGVASVRNVFPDRLPGVRAYKVPADSMAPTVMSGERIVADMRYYKSHAPSRGDVVAIATPPMGTLTIKRVVAVAGDVIEGNPQMTMVNRQTIREPYLGAVPDDQEARSDPSLTFGPITVPANEVFVLGDNRTHSYDSRYFGPARINQIKGKVLYIYFSADKSRVGRKIR
jgi:signal peptidase I